ncbi:MAG: amidohydrolase family protein [Wenzhouxiangellaceae bacterium]|nr:amidohydrolase family protein [Wenzhouxiangellaceae bacterium]
MRYVFFVLCALLIGPLHAAELRQPLPSTYAIVDVRIVPAPGEVLESATIVVRDGIIEAVGSDIEPPPDAALVTFERGSENDEDQPPITVYAGLIDPYLAVASDENSDGGGNDNGNGDDEDGGSVPGRHPLIRPDRRLDPAAWPADTVEAHRRAGFTTALMAPAVGLLRGNSVLANLGDGGMSANLLAENVAQHAHLDERSPDGNYPQSLMGSVALFRQSLLDAAWQQSARNAWQANPAQSRPEWLAGMDVLAPVLAGEQPLVVKSEDALDSLRILDLVDGEIDLVLVGHGEEYKRLDDFDRKVPHILPLDFPAAPDVEAENDGHDNRDASLEELRHWKYAPENPARLVEAGFPVLLTAHGQSNPEDLFGQVAKAVEHGLDADAALAALTTGPAEWLGIADRAGRIAAGYMANLVIVDGELFGEETTINEVWVDGHRFELTRLVPPEVDPAGTWDLTLGLAGMGDVDATLKLSGEPANMDGILMVMGNETPLSEARVSGKRLQVRIDAARFGEAGTITINMDIDGDRGRGNGSGPFGEFTVRGTRSSGPGDEETRI